MAPIIVSASIDIAASPARVWQLLTDPEWTPKYMFGCRTISDWKLGSSLLWEADVEGKKVVYVKGSIVELEPHRLLRYTVFDPFAAYPDVPENYLTVTYRITPRANGVTLAVTQGDYATVVDGEKRYQDTVAGPGWGGLLEQIKRLAE